MNNRRRLTALVGAGQSSLQFPILGEVALATVARVLAAARRTLMALGLAAIAALALMFFRPELLDDLKALSPFSDSYDEIQASPAGLAFADMLELPAHLPATNAAADTAAAAGAAAAAQTREQQRVTQWLAKRYRIAVSASRMFVGAAFESAEAVKIDPLLVLAVMAIESRFNPFAESAVGAQGLMQVMSKVHHDKFSNHGGVAAALNPAANIQVGATILKDMIRRTGSVEAGLKLYVGAGNLETDGGYAEKVMAEYGRLQAVAAGKRVPTFTRPQPPSDSEVREAKAEPKPAAHPHTEPEPA
ncbi:MAG: lytic transglycosylase domain-containing protein [Burkholderiaceae bacterium]|nr:lytic transglycosylase domain-containing protein [Burkholderiaceae bacterium]